MSVSTCPNGHQSTADDYCDVCGSPIEKNALNLDAAQPSSAPDPAATPVGGPQECPNCSTSNPEAALFCEACGYDFTTGAMPRTSDPSLAASQAMARNAAGEPDDTQPGLPVLSDPSDPNHPADPNPTADPNPPSRSQQGPTEITIEPGTSTGGTSAQPGWVVEVWVDPDWYQTQQADDPCPSPGLPLIVPLTGRSALIGRPSSSRNIHPDIDLSSDPGVSRRHANLTSDGKRWFIEDLDSSNGTFVGGSSGALPKTAIPVGPKKELSDDDRVYVGAWTRMVVREAAPGELDSLT